MSKRFAEVSDADVELLMKEKYAKTTRYNHHYADNIFVQFCLLKDFTYDGDKLKLAIILKEFFASLRKKDGDEFRLSGFLTVYHSLCRILKERHDIDVKEESEFKCVQEMIACIKTKLKKSGNGFIQHTIPVSNEDLKKIGEMDCSSPKLLQLKVWFLIQLHLAKRGMENCHEMEKDDLYEEEDSSGRKYMKLRDRLTKNHRGDSSQQSYGGIIMSSNDEKCPVKIISLYKGKLCHENKYFWQKPKSQFSNNSASFCNQKVGINKISCFMKNICNVLNLSKTYSNHSVRSTSISLLGQYFEDTDVATVSGHKSLESLKVYKETSTVKKQAMSKSLHMALNGDAPTSSNNLHALSYEKSVDLNHTHNQCCLSIGAHQSSSSNNYITSASVDCVDLDNVDLNNDCVDNFLTNFTGDLANEEQYFGNDFDKHLQHSKTDVNRKIPGFMENADAFQCEKSTTYKNKVMKISDKAFVISGSNTVINFNINVSK
jgi:hypothetical protein